MRGHIRKRYKDSWNIILDIGYQLVPDTGNMKRVQKWFTVKGTKRDAERKLTELLHHLHRGEYVEPICVYLSRRLQMVVVGFLSNNGLPLPAA